MNQDFRDGVMFVGLIMMMAMLFTLFLVRRRTVQERKRVKSPAPPVPPRSRTELDREEALARSQIEASRLRIEELRLRHRDRLRQPPSRTTPALGADFSRVFDDMGRVFDDMGRTMNISTSTALRDLIGTVEQNLRSAGISEENIREHMQVSVTTTTTQTPPPAAAPPPPKEQPKAKKEPEPTPKSWQRRLMDDE